MSLRQRQMKYIKFTPKPYTLYCKGQASSREGALLRFEFADGLVGYADCHPWQSFGDEPLNKQLTLLQNNQLTLLTQRSLYFARLDAEARHQNVNLFRHLKIPQSHFLILDLKNCHLESPLKQGYTCFKVKLGKDLNYEIEKLKDAFLEVNRVRLDFNMALNQIEFERFLEKISSHLDKVDFIEDPFPFQHDSWKQLQASYPINLASDLNCMEALGHHESARVLIIKPAIQTVPVVSEKQRIVITSYLDHPFGQLCAAYCAAQTQGEICGLQSHLVYEPTSFSERLGNQGPFMLPPSGTGFGFDDLLH